MNGFGGQVWTYTNDYEPVKIKQAEILQNKHPAHSVSTYQDLVEKIAYLSFLNKEQCLFFRGQRKEYFTEGNNISVYPHIYRDSGEDSKRLTKVTIDERYQELTDAVSYLRSNYPNHSLKYAKEHKALRYYDEICWAILQHYDITATPLIDITMSLRVASSFALNNSASGYVYVFGLPYPHATLSYYVDTDMKLVCLQSSCPPSAKRPHYQEGYLVGSFNVNKGESRQDHNLTQRMIARFFIPDKHVFWSSCFRSIPDEALKPQDDKDFGWLRNFKS